MLFRFAYLCACTLWQQACMPVETSDGPEFRCPIHATMRGYTTMFHTSVGKVTSIAKGCTLCSHFLQCQQVRNFQALSDGSQSVSLLWERADVRCQADVYDACDAACS